MLTSFNTTGASFGFICSKLVCDLSEPVESTELTAYSLYCLSNIQHVYLAGIQVLDLGQKNSCIFLGKMSIGGLQLDHVEFLGLDLPNEAGMFKQLRMHSSLQRASISKAQQDPSAHPPYKDKQTEIPSWVPGLRKLRQIMCIFRTLAKSKQDANC